jgi:hypothetical protein
MGALQAANAINASGKVVGRGLHNGQNRAYLLAPQPKPSDPLHVKTIEFVASEVRILFGVIEGGGGVVILADGTILKIGPDPAPDPVYRALFRAMQEMLPGLAVRQIAAQSSHTKARQEIERGGLSLVEQAAKQLLQTLESLKST